MSTNFAAALGSVSNSLAVAVGILLPIAWISLLLRLWVRKRMLKSLGWDDWTILAACMIFTAHCGIVLELYHKEKTENFGSLPALQNFFSYYLAVLDIYNVENVVLKISLTIFFLRIIVQKWQRYLLLITCTLYTLYQTAFFFIIIFACGNPKNYFINSLGKTCSIKASTLLALEYVQAVANSSTDWIFAIVPILALSTLQLPRAAKVSAGVCIALGAVGSIASVVRIALLHNLQDTSKIFTHLENYEIWSIIEVGLGIIAISLATLRPLLKKCMRQFRGSNESSTPRHDLYAYGQSKTAASAKNTAVHAETERQGLREAQAGIAKSTTIATVISGGSSTEAPNDWADFPLPGERGQDIELGLRSKGFAVNVSDRKSEDESLSSDTKE